MEPVIAIALFMKGFAEHMAGSHSSLLPLLFTSQYSARPKSVASVLFC